MKPRGVLKESNEKPFTSDVTCSVVDREIERFVRQGEMPSIYSLMDLSSIWFLNYKNILIK
jgi:hypothetical protein